MTHSLLQRNIRVRLKTDDPLYQGQKKLKLRGRDLVNLPSDVFKLMDLEVLDLSPDRESCLSYKITTLPADIGKLLNLSTLLLDTNELEQVPAELTLLTNLERLTLSNNFLSDLPKGVGRLKKLTSLHLANNKFERFPLELCDVTSLIFLDFSDNQIKVIPRKIGQLTKLQTLLMFINRIVKLPDSFVKLTELRCLWLGENDIRALPKGFGYLTKLDWKDRYTSSALDSNPLVNPPLHICRLGPAAIEQFQGVGPNIDAQKKAEEDLKRDGRKPRPMMYTGRSRNGAESVKSDQSNVKLLPDVTDVSSGSRERISRIPALNLNRKRN